jgi:hypothetical protein
MSDQTLFGEDELAFEQLMLGAGRAEAVPQERTETALLRFAAGIAALQGGVGGAAAAAGPAAGLAARPWARLVAAGKWLALGIVAGGVATFAWLRPTTPPPGPSSPVAAVVAPAAPPALAAAPPQPAKATEPLPVSTLLETARGQRVSSAATSAQPAVKPGPDLAAEVAALDGIRTAISIGALRDADLKLASYRRKFAQGALRSEAEVLALEVLVAQGNTPAAARAAERFISQHPRDPQLARVRALVE